MEKKKYISKNIYKIIVEKRPDEDFTRYIPMSASSSSLEASRITPSMSKPRWTLVNVGEMFGKDFVKIKKEAESSIDCMEEILKVQSGFYVLEEYEYTPKL